MLSRLTLTALVPLALTACPGPLSSLRYKSVLATPVGQFEVEYSARDREAQERVQRAVRNAAPKLNRWGALRDLVTIRVMPNHELLEQAIDRHGYSWLRAWAVYDQVFLQSPRTWAFFGATQHEIDDVVLHELTHCVMYQQSASRTAWTRKEIPLWFREGMATFNASQGYRYASLEELASFYDQHPGQDPVADGDGMYQEMTQIVYGAAHHAFTFLVRRYGEDQVRAILTRMTRGPAFPEAFHGSIGVTPLAFTEDFKRYVRLRAFRGGRIKNPSWARALAPPLPPGEPAPPPPPPPPDATGCIYR